MKKFILKSFLNFKGKRKLLRIMKLTMLLLIVCFVQVSATIYSQNTKFTFDIKNKPIVEILRNIEDQSEFRFFFQREQIDVERKVDLKVTNQTIERIITQLFENQGIDFDIREDFLILLKPKGTTPGNYSFWTQIEQQQRTVSGKVTDSNGLPLPGVSIVVKGTTQGTVTNADGEYSITNIPANSTLVFSFVGMKSQEVIVGTQTNIDITMEEDVIGIEEVVAIGYGTQRKVNLTGAVSQVSSEVLESRPITNIGQGLQGLVPNLNIEPVSGAPGRGVEFNIRGTTSITGGEPLILVDGVEMDPNILNPKDITNISVLKDAASAAIYGARAAFGVILIETKSGLKSEKPVISFNSNYSFNKPTVVPEYMNSVEYVEWMNTAFMNTNGIPYFDDEQVDHVQAYFNDPVNNPNVYISSATPESELYHYCGNTDWMEVLTNNYYPMQQYTLSVNGGTEKVSYYTSLGYYDQGGLNKTADEKYNRYNLLQNIRYEITDWLKLSAKAALNSINKKMRPSNNWGAYGEDAIFWTGDSRPIMPVYHPDGNYAGLCYSGEFTNPVAFNEQGGYQKQINNDLLLKGAVQIIPIESIKINIDYSYNIFYDNYMSYIREYWQYNALGERDRIFPHTVPNRVIRENDHNKYSAFNIYSEYEKMFLTKHYLKAMVGFNQEFRQNNWFSAGRRNLVSNDIPYMSLAYGERAVNDLINEYAIRGLFGRINYTYDERYLIEFNGRYDGSSRFPKEDRFAFFPSASVGWRISNESFFETLKNTISEFKFRASYGNLGNQAVAAYYPYIAQYGTSTVNFIIDGDKPLTTTPPGIVSPYLTWEKVTQYNFGIDFGLIENKIQGTFDIYQRNTKDMLTKSKTLPSVLGTSEPQMNAADLKTYGYEITLSYKKLFNNDFRFIGEFLFADAQSEITKYDNPKGIFSDYYVGKKVGEIWGFVTDGLFQSDEEALSLDQSEINGRKFLAGDIKFKDLNNDGEITRGNQTLDDHGDMKIIGNNTPRYNYGIKTNIFWKGFDFNIFFQGVGKREVNMGSLFFLDGYRNQWQVPQKFNTDYWSPDNTDAYFPRPRAGNASEIFQVQTRFLQNAAYIRLKQLTLGYTIPSILTSKIGIKNCRIYFGGNNIWEYTKMLKIFDPEITQLRTYPFTRNYSLGLDITF
jgi:TonB-linked SusC/RagA family outer membrane protein